MYGIIDIRLYTIVFSTGTVGRHSELMYFTFIGEFVFTNGIPPNHKDIKAPVFCAGVHHRIVGQAIPIVFAPCLHARPLWPGISTSFLQLELTWPTVRTTRERCAATDALPF